MSISSNSIVYCSTLQSTKYPTVILSACQFVSDIWKRHFSS